MENSINTCMALGSSLPLIFVGGRPTCLDNMTLSQLKRFIPFMMNCEGVGHEIPLVANKNSAKPCWWPFDLEFSMNIFSGNVSADEVVNRLRDIVRRCYRKYGLCAIIDLSTSMSDPKNAFGFVRVEHNDNGTSNVISCSNKLVVTIRTSVVKYDEEMCSPETNVVIRESLHNSPILKLVESNYTDSKYTDGRMQLPLSSVNSISDLNPRVVLPGVHFVNSRGHKVKYPFKESNPKSKNVFMAGKASASLGGGNVCKVVVLSDNETSENCLGQRRGSRLSLASGAKIGDGQKCRHCGKVFGCEEFCKDHEGSCSSAPQSPNKTDSETKLDFMSHLNLLPAKKVKKMEPVKEKYKMILNDMNTVTTIVPKGPKRSKKNKPRLSRPKQISSFFKNHPIPFTSGLGLQLVLNSDTGLCTESTNLDQFCSTSDRMPQSNTHNWSVTTLKKKVIQSQDWVHTYAFNSKQKKIRATEIVIGINEKAWSSLNKCKQSFVHIRKDDIIPVNLLPSKIAATTVVNGSQLPGTIQSNQPLDALDRSSFEGETPVIRIENIFKLEKYAKYFQKPALTN